MYASSSYGNSSAFSSFFFKENEGKESDYVKRRLDNGLALSGRFLYGVYYNN
jgi:hypothetical protein